MKIKEIGQLIGSILLCHLAGALGSIFTVSQVDSWLTTLERPFFQPPDWVFGPVWLILYTLMGIAFFLIWQRTHSLFKKAEAKNLVFLFLIHLVFNAIWTPIFFGLHQIGLALIILIIIVGTLKYIMYRAWKLDRRVTYLLIPYLLWVGFATILNFSIWLLNT